ncbi:MAG: helix-turn-helix transcriptional regulator [Lachnospiraceae bacterium]
MKDRLKKIRSDNGLSQEEFAKRIGLESRGHISALEKGTRNITDRTINDNGLI